MENCIVISKLSYILPKSYIFEEQTQITCCLFAIPGIYYGRYTLNTNDFFTKYGPHLTAIHRTYSTFTPDCAGKKGKNDMSTMSIYIQHNYILLNLTSVLETRGHSKQKVSQSWSKLVTLGHWGKLVTNCQVTNYQLNLQLVPWPIYQWYQEKAELTQLTNES